MRSRDSLRQPAAGAGERDSRLVTAGPFQAEPLRRRARCAPGSFQWAAVLPFLAIALLLPSAARAQRAPSSLRGSVRAAETGEPLSGALVELVGTDHSAVSGANGAYRILDLTAGTYRIRVSYLGRSSHEMEVELEPGRILRANFELRVQAIAVEELQIRVEAEQIRSRMNGFYKRRDRGYGEFITREELDRSPTGRIGDTFRRIPGVQVEYCYRDRYQIPGCETVRIRRCRPPFIWLDGMRISARTLIDMGGINFLDPHDVEGIEVYSRATAPAQFSTVGGECALVIWTRDGG
ncbi:MAG: carboxypeptidase regulatory-like domain-containing protein [Gemmatimonadota bacterium]